VPNSLNVERHANSHVVSRKACLPVTPHTNFMSITRSTPIKSSPQDGCTVGSLQIEKCIAGSHICVIVDANWCAKELMRHQFNVIPFLLAMFLVAVGAGIFSYVMMTTVHSERAATALSGEPMRLRHGKYLTPLGIMMMTSPQKWILLLTPLGLAALLPITGFPAWRSKFIRISIALAVTSGVAAAISWLWVFQ
jgi:hypothetical protein